MKLKNNPKISVVMSAYNSEKYLAEAMESILNQTFKDFEFIIINDGSSDKTLQIIRDYAKKDKRIKLINNSKNIGQTPSRNKALKIAKGRYIAIMDSDDISLPNRFEIQYDYLEKNSDIFLVGSRIMSIDEKGVTRTRSNTLTDIKDIKSCLIQKNCIAHPSIMFRNEYKNFYREKFRYSEDYDFYLNLLSRNKKLINLKNKLLKYRRSNNSIGIYRASIEYLFAEKAKEFYNQRLKSGKDKYDNFYPQEILNLDIENSNNRSILRYEIKASFKVNNFKRTRIFCKKYFKNYGYLNKILIYYFASFFGKKIINFLRKIIF